MKLSHRSKISLIQLLLAIEKDDLILLFEKYFNAFATYLPNFPTLHEVREAIMQAKDEQIEGICEELVRTHDGLSKKVVPRYAFYGRWEDLKRCLSLDNLLVKDAHMISERKIAPIEPAICEQSVIEDDLTTEIRKTGFDNVEAILKTLNSSAEGFLRNPPNYNGCLANARVALQEIAKTIALSRKATHPGNFNETKWGGILVYLRSSGFITKEEEEGLTGVFTFVSPGAHRPIGMSEEEFTRLGRIFILGMCYFLIREFNGSRST